MRLPTFRNRLSSKRPLPLFIFRLAEHNEDVSFLSEKKEERCDDNELTRLSFRSYSDQQAFSFSYSLFLSHLLFLVKYFSRDHFKYDFNII